MFLELHKKTKKSRILSDVNIVTEHARHLFEFSQDVLIYKENSQGKLGVIAIVGNTHSPIHGEFEKALLCEIGIGRVRPYGIAELPKNNALDYHAKTIKARKQLFSLSRKQYEKVAPLVFSLLQKIAAEKICSWQCNHRNPFVIKATNNRWLKARKTLVQQSANREMASGTRFSISTNELFLLEDVHWAELFGNEKLSKQLRGLSRIISFPLNHYLGLKTQRSLRDLPKYSTIQTLCEVSPFPHYLKIFMLNHLPANIRNYFWEDLLELLGWDGSKIVEERHAMRVLPHPQERLRKIELRLTHYHASSTIKVFEVYPSDTHLSAAEKATTPTITDDNGEDLPF